MTVFWTINARRRLRSALSPQLCASTAAAGTTTTFLDRRIEELSRILTATFQDASGIVVQGHLLGFRRRDNLFVLLVEVFGGEGEGTSIVKIGSEDQLAKELNCWRTCRPEGLTHDLVLLPLRGGVAFAEGLSQLHGSNVPAMSLIYGDAHQFIGVEQVTSLEEAVRDAVRFGTPSLSSLEFVFGELYERLSHLLYAQSFEQCPTNETNDDGQPRFVLDIKHLAESLVAWEAGIPAELRTLALGALMERTRSSHFIDPVDYLSYARRFVHWVDQHGNVQSPAPPKDPTRTLPTPRLDQVIPCLAIGNAHGDLHGRNVLVGRVRDRVLWPTVFDYENMSTCNRIGWDFVKMETELKIRIYPRLFRQPLSRMAVAGRQQRLRDSQEKLYAESVQEFEVLLDVKTEECHRNGDWPTMANSSDPIERLQMVLLAIRERAARHLGDDLGRPQRWLEEYYFLLACYGVCTVRFANLQPKQLVGAFVAAGVAAARLNWAREFDKWSPTTLAPA